MRNVRKNEISVVKREKLVQKNLKVENIILLLHIRFSIIMPYLCMCYNYDIEIKTPIHLISKQYSSMLYSLSLNSKDIDYLGVQVLPETLKYNLTQQENLNYIDLLAPYFILKNIL